jgi:hypothetical protein
MRATASRGTIFIGRHLRTGMSMNMEHSIGFSGWCLIYCIKTTTHLIIDTELTPLMPELG